MTRRYVVLPYGIIFVIIGIAVAFALLIWFGWDRWSDLS